MLGLGSHTNFPRVHEIETAGGKPIQSKVMMMMMMMMTLRSSMKGDWVISRVLCLSVFYYPPPSSRELLLYVHCAHCTVHIHVTHTCYNWLNSYQTYCQAQGSDCMLNVHLILHLNKAKNRTQLNLFTVYPKSSTLVPEIYCKI